MGSNELAPQMDYSSDVGGNEHDSRRWKIG